MAKTIDVSGFEIPDVNPVWAYFYLERPAWCVLAFGWLGCLLSVYFGFEVPSSGGLLVGCSVLAEVFHEKQRWRQIRVNGPIPVVKYGNKEGTYLFGTGEKKGRSPKLNALLSLTFKKHHSVLRDGTAEYELLDAVSGVDNAITWSIIATTALGTLLWAYGHLLFPAYS